jgi:hypothetical protein
VLDAGVPFGRYTLCFQDTSTGRTRFWSPGSYPNTGSTAVDSNPNNDSDAYDNTTPPTGQATTETFTNASQWPRGSCPT